MSSELHQAALDYHQGNRPGKLIVSSHLSLCKIVRSSVILLLPINIFNTSLYSLGVQCDRYIAWLSIVSGDYRWLAFRSTWYFCVCESSCCSKLFHFRMYILYYSLIALQIAEASCFIRHSTQFWKFTTPWTIHAMFALNWPTSFQRRRLLNNFPIGSYVKTMSVDGGYFGSRSGSLNTILEGYKYD